jgi:hypothetical protein
MSFFMLSFRAAMAALESSRWSDRDPGRAAAEIPARLTPHGMTA